MKLERLVRIIVVDRMNRATGRMINDFLSRYMDDSPLFLKAWSKERSFYAKLTGFK